jgi:hypothetical protein
MPGNDNVVLNTRERPLSSDINDLQSLAARSLADVLRYALAPNTLAAVNPSSTPGNFVLGGLEAIPNGNNISINPGALCQDSNALSPAPSSLDSAYRLAYNRSALTVTMPSPVGTTYYLVEAQMTDVVAATASRDILDATSGNFVPTLVNKRKERQITTQVLTGAGSNAPAPSGGDWVPIAIVRRPGGGGAVSASDIMDVRPLWSDILTARTNMILPGNGEPGEIVGGELVTTHVPNGAASNLLARFSAAARLPNGKLAFFRFVSTGSNDITNAVFTAVSPFAANTFYYLYLCPWHGLLPSQQGAQLPAVPTLNRGLLVVSATPPGNGTQDGILRNNVALTLPSPFADSTAPVGSSICVAAILRNSANTGWVSMTSPDLHEFRIPMAEALGTTAGPTAGVTNATHTHTLVAGTHFPVGGQRELLLAHRLSTNNPSLGTPYGMSLFASIDGTTNGSEELFYGGPDVTIKEWWNPGKNGSVVKLISAVMIPGGAHTVDISTGCLVTGWRV